MTENLHDALAQSVRAEYGSTAQVPTASQRERERRPSFYVLEGLAYFKQPNMSDAERAAATTPLQRLEYALNILNQICIGFVTIYVSWLCLRTGLAGTGLHAWLVTLGFSFLMAEGIMSHYASNLLTKDYKTTTKTTVHWLLMSLGAALGLSGVLIKISQKGLSLTSTHAKFGFATLILCLITLLSGLSALYSLRLQRLLSPLLNKTLHNLLGIFTFTAALIAQFYGYETGYFRRKAAYDLIMLMKFLTLLSLLLSLLGPMRALSRRTANVIRQFR